jgi:hypothetical protein
MKKLHDSTTSHNTVRSKKGLQDLFVLHVSHLEKMVKPWFAFQKMRRRKLYKSCRNKFLLENKKVFQTLFIVVRSRTIM